jgi:hypothetical protein
MKDLETRVLPSPHEMIGMNFRATGFSISQVTPCQNVDPSNAVVDHVLRKIGDWRICPHWLAIGWACHCTTPVTIDRASLCMPASVKRPLSIVTIQPSSGQSSHQRHG